MSGAAMVVLVAVALVAAWAFDRWRRRSVWGKKSDEELTALVAATEWRWWQLALEELKRRGRDLASVVPLVAGHLLGGSNMERAAARIVLMKVYPESRPLLKGYEPADDEAARRKALEPLMATAK